MAVLVAPEMWFLQGPATDVEANKLRTTAAAFRRMLDASLSYRQGVVYTRGTCTDLYVQATGAPDGFIHVLAGSCYVRGTQAANQGMYHLYNDATLNINVLGANPAHATLNRIDLVVARFQDQFYSGAVDLPTIEMVTGTPNASPAVPAAPANSLILAQLSIVAASSTIPQSVITDRRVPAGNGIVVLDDILVGTDSRYPAATAQVDFLNASGVGTNLIPPGMSDLEILLQGRSDQAASQGLNLRLNNDSAANYDNERVLASAASVSATESGAGPATAAIVGQLPGTAILAGAPGISRIWIPNYSGSIFKKMFRSDWSFFFGATFGITNSHQLDAQSFLWNNAAPITRISVLPSAGLLLAGTRIRLLGHIGFQP